MNNLQFRKGQPVLFELCDDFSQSNADQLRSVLHTVADGSFVGIYEPAGSAPNAAAGKPGQPDRIATPERIVPMKPSGENLRIPDPSGRPKFVLLALEPTFVKNVRPLLNRADMPPGRVLAPDWVPHAD